MATMLHRQPVLLLFLLAAPCAGLRALREQPEHVALLSSDGGEGPRLLRPWERHAHSGHRRGSANGGAAVGLGVQGTCTTLQNRGTHFTARIEVGTPPQPFDVVADTGSDSVIVNSCFCKKLQTCKEGKCYTGFNHSSTFGIPAATMSSVPVIDLSFGSGKLEAVVATDVVRVGAARATMNNGLLLMIEQALNMPGPFEGILGLGLPRSKAAVAAPPEEQGSGMLSKKNTQVSPLVTRFDSKSKPAPTQASTAVAQFVSTPAERDDSPTQVSQPVARLYSNKIPVTVPSLDVGAASAASSVAAPTATPASIDSLDGSTPQDPSAAYTARSFLQAAGVSRFSMCFNDGTDGVLRLGGPRDPNALGSIGTEHWGLEMTGLQVGDVSAPAVVCGPDTKLRPGQKTACGAIPDSGTTILLGPADHLQLIFSAICDNWDRCREFAKKYPKRTKLQVLNTALYFCEDWLPEEGLKNLPSVYINLRGSGGQTQTIEIPPRLWVLELTTEQVPESKKHLWGFGKKAKETRREPQKKCAPAFGQMEYNTTKNGPVWILGSPVFYQYQVGYDMENSPPAISFSKTPCGTCERQTSFFAGNSEIRLGAPQAAAPSLPPQRSTLEMPRRLSGPILSKELDTSRPL